MSQLVVAVGTRLTAIFAGFLGAALLVVLFIFGKFRVENYWRLITTVAKGNTILALNHPTLVETGFVPCLLWPIGAIWPERFFIWNLPQVSLFPWWLQWLNQWGHCIPVQRNQAATNRRSLNAGALRKKNDVLVGGGTVCEFAEAGRTHSPNRKHPDHPIILKGKKYGRVMKEITSGSLVRAAHKAESTILPIWVEVPFVKEANGFVNVLARLLFGFKGDRMTIYVGDPYQIDPETNIRDAAVVKKLNRELGRRIRAAGKEVRS